MKCIRAFTLFLSLFLCSTSQAQVKTEGGFTVYYSAVNSTFLTPEIASQYGITRGDRNAFLNISVQRTLDGGMLEPVEARVTGVKRNLLQQSTNIEFLEVREGSSIYYIGQFEFTNAEPVMFELEILPEGSSRTIPLEWSTRVYTNN